MQILTNHLGYDCGGPKHAVVQVENTRGAGGHAEGGAGDTRDAEGAGDRGVASTADRSVGAWRLGDESLVPGLGFRVIRVRDGAVVSSGRCAYRGAVDRWSRGRFYTLDFDELSEAGWFRLEVVGNSEAASAGSGAGATDGGAAPRAASEESGQARGNAGAGATAARSGVPGDGDSIAVSEPFEIAPGLLFRETFSNVLSYFKGQRCGGDEDLHDRTAAFHDERSDRVDVHGGWFDASGDTSKYLSHLSYANYLNPQQTPGVVWAMLEARDVLERSTDAADRAAEPEPNPKSRSVVPSLWERRLREEAAWGADFLVRMQDEQGYFYMTVFDRWSKSLDARIISSFRTQQGHRGSDYEAGMRQGGGMAVAALARAAAGGISGAFDKKRYLSAAVRGFEHLAAHNTEYLDDGRENIIDDYCGLLAAAELYAATGEQRFLAAARSRFGTLRSRFGAGPKPAGHWYADAPGGRAYYHAAEAGLPVMAILRYAELDPAGSERAEAQSVARSAMESELAVTEAVTNPFGYARQYVSVPGAPPFDSFFIPHTNESGYWWQGENARLASLAAAALWARRGETQLGSAAAKYAQNQLNWILGLNPLDICMMDGVGRNNPEYTAEFPNAPGGICNGITGGFEDEHDIAFLPWSVGESPFHRWRWSEQWIPHAGWFLLAVTLSLNENSRTMSAAVDQSERGERG